MYLVLESLLLALALNLNIHITYVFAAENCLNAQFARNFKFDLVFNSLFLQLAAPVDGQAASTKAYK